MLKKIFGSTSSSSARIKELEDKVKELEAKIAEFELWISKIYNELPG